MLLTLRRLGKMPRYLVLLPGHVAIIAVAEDAVNACLHCMASIEYDAPDGQEVKAVAVEMADPEPFFVRLERVSDGWREIDPDGLLGPVRVLGAPGFLIERMCTAPDPVHPERTVTVGPFESVSTDAPKLVISETWTEPATQDAGPDGKSIVFPAADHWAVECIADHRSVIFGHGDMKAEPPVYRAREKGDA